MNLNSKKYPNIIYEKGEGIFLTLNEADLNFFFDVEETLTADNEAMAVVADMLDDIDTLAETAKACLKNILANEEDEYYETVAFFMEFHRDELEPDMVAELFPVENPSALSFSEMVDYLKINRFGSLIDDELEEQVFIMDLSFNPEITDELMVIYFDLEKDVIYIAHES